MTRARIPDDEGFAAVAAVVLAQVIVDAAGVMPSDADSSGGSAAFGVSTSSATPGWRHSVFDAVGDRGARRESLAMAVRYLLQLLAEKAPGHTLEVRVPPFGAVQCVEGPRHTRGTPPNVIEMPPLVWVALATGQLSWDQAISEALVQASGTRAELRGLVPVAPRSLLATVRKSSRGLSGM